MPRSTRHLITNTHSTSSPRNTETSTTSGGEVCVNVRDSKLTLLPLHRAFQAADKLRFLLLDNNEIESLPPSVNCLTALVVLSASNNRISKVYRLDGEKLLAL